MAHQFIYLFSVMQQYNNIEYGWTATEESLSSYFVVFLSILAFILVLSSLLHNSKLSSILPEAGLTVIIGLIAGTLIYFLGDEEVNDDEVNNNNHDLAEGLLSFNSKVFFVFLLPPIIFNSGYHINKEYFIKFFKPIVLFACLGTALSTITVALILFFAVELDFTGGFKPSFPELLTFGALISATDPVSTLAVFQQKRVDPKLFYLVFGESVLNDAVGLVLFNTFAKFVGQENTLYSSSKGALFFLIDFCISFVGSLFLGLLSGIVAGYILKVADMRHTRLLELSSYILIMYAPFFAAEVLPFSGIVTSLFTGIAAKQYAEPNLSPQTAQDADLIFRVIAHLAETSLFLELGLSVFGLAFGNFYPLFVLFAIIGCLIGRLVNIYPMTFFFNKSTRNVTTSAEDPEDIHSTDMSADGRTITQRINLNTAHMLWFSGLRGAVAYGCAKSFPNNNLNRAPFVVTTMVIILLTVFLLGGTTEYVLHKLNIEMNVDENTFISDGHSFPQNSIIDKFERRFIFPWVIRTYGSDRRSQNFEQMDQNEEGSTAEFEMRDMGNLELTSTSPQPTIDKKDSLYDFGAK